MEAVVHQWQDVTAIDRLKSTLSRHPDESTTTVIQPGDKCKAKASSGLEVPPAATFSTCV